MNNNVKKGSFPVSLVVFVILAFLVGTLMGSCTKEFLMSSHMRQQMNEMNTFLDQLNQSNSNTAIAERSTNPVPEFDGYTLYNGKRPRAKTFLPNKSSRRVHKDHLERCINRCNKFGNCRGVGVHPRANDQVLCTMHTNNTPRDGDYENHFFYAKN